MPSGAKKRKAAKKKKGTQPNNNPNPSLASTQGGGDVKQQDDRQSDVGEASSTTSQEHPSHHDLLTEGEEERIENRENTSDLPQAEGVKIEDNKHDVVVEGSKGNAVSVEREFKIEDEFSGKFEHDETERKSYDGGSSGSSSSSSSSSSDDESQGVKSSHAVIDAAQVSAKVDHSLHEEFIEAVPTMTIGEASDAVVDSTPPVVSDKVSLLSESVEVDTSSPAKSSMAPSVVESEFKEDGGEKRGSETFKDAAPQQEEATIPSVENVAATSDPKICATEETDERLSLSYNAPIATHDNGADFEKDSGVTEPLLVPPPRPVQTTSWKGCCGLFELFTGSDR